MPVGVSAGEKEKITRNESDIPLTFIGTYDLPPDPQMAAAVRRGQRAFVNRFSPGRLIRLDVPHYMEPVIPERIAREIERVIDAASGE